MEYKKRLQRNIVLFYALNFFTGLLFPVGIWVAFERRVLTFEQMALFSAVSTGIETVLQIPTGAFADLLGRKKSLCIGWIIIGIAYVYEAFAMTPWMFFLAFCGVGIGTALSSGADVALVYDSLKIINKEEKYPKIAAKMKLFYRFAIASATLTGGLLYGVNIRLPYILLAIAIFISLLFILLMQETDLPSEPFSIKGYVVQKRQGFQELGRSSYIKGLVVYYTLVGSITWACLNYFNLPFMTDVGYSSAQLGILFAIAYMVAAIVIYRLTQIKNKITRTRVYLAFPLLMIAGLLPGVFANRFIAPVLLILVMLAGSGRLTFLDTYVNQEFMSKYRATALSALNMLVSITYIILVSIGGKIQDAHGTKIIYTILGTITLLFVVPSAIYMTKQHKKDREKTIAIEPSQEQVIG